MAIVSPIAVQVNPYSDIKPGQEKMKAHSVEDRTASFQMRAALFVYNGSLRLLLHQFPVF